MGNELSGDPSEMPYNYPNFGLPCSLQELKETFSSIHTKNIEEQAQYADMVYKTHIENEEWLLNQLNTSDELIQKNGKNVVYRKFNTVSVGNMAYGALHSPTKKLMDRHRNIVKSWCDWKTNDIKGNSSTNIPLHTH